jgi:hypothetical protein
MPLDSAQTAFTVHTFQEYADAGYLAEVIPIIPPGAKLSEKSGVVPQQCGKIPGEYSVEWANWRGMHHFTTRVFDRSHLRKWQRWKPDPNKGLRTGLLLAVDLDCNNPAVAEVRRAAGEDLGHTIVRGRENSDRQLMVYQLKEGEIPPHKGRVAFTDPKDPEADLAVEFLGWGGQFVCEGVHPKGGNYYWANGRDPITVGRKGIPEITVEQWSRFIDKTAALLEAMGYTVISNSLSSGSGSRYPIPYDRHLADDQDELKRALTFFPNDEHGEQDHGSCVQIIAAFKAGMGGDGEDEARAWYLRFSGNDDAGFDGIWKSITDSKLGADWLYANAREHGYGGVDLPPLEDEPAAAADSVRAEDISQPKWLREMNAEWFYAEEGGKGAYWRKDFDLDTQNTIYVPYSATTFGQHYENKHQAGDQNRTDADVWRAHPRRHEYLKGIVFQPGEDVTEGYFNLWQGWGVEPKPGDCGLFKQHLFEVICDGNAAYAVYLWKLLAFMFQRPTERGHPAVVLRSSQNKTGKGVFVGFLRELAGKHGMLVSNSDHVVGKFNGHLKDKLVLECDEALFSGDKKQKDALKSLVGDNTLPIENKFFPVTNVRNRLHLFMLSNHDHTISVDPGEEERYFVLNVAEHRHGDRAYFRALCDQMDHGGRAALLYELLAEDLTGFDPRAVPQTEGLSEQKAQSLDDGEAWYRQLLKDAGWRFKEFSDFCDEDFVCKANDPGWAGRAMTISKKAVHEHYLEYRKSMGERGRAKSVDALGRMLARFSQHTIQPLQRKKGGDVIPIYVFPKLSECRAAFDQVMKSTTKWDDDEMPTNPADQ